MAWVTETMEEKYIYITNGVVNSTGATMYSGESYETPAYSIGWDTAGAVYPPEWSDGRKTNTYMVKMFSTQGDHTTTNKITNIPMPISMGNSTTKDVQNRVINLKRITDMMKLNGYLKDESPGDTAIEQKQKLRFFCGATDTGYGKYGNIIGIVWSNRGTYQEYWGFIEKILAKEMPSKDKVNITLQFMMGELMGGS